MLNSLAAPHLIPTGLYTESPARGIVQFVTGPVGPPDARRGYCLDSNTAADLVRVRRPAFSMSVPLGRRWVRARERRSLPQNNGAGMAELLIKELIASVDLQRLSSAPNALPGNDRTSLMLHRDAAPGYWRHPDTRACPPKTAALPDPATGKRGRGAADWVAQLLAIATGSRGIRFQAAAGSILGEFLKRPPENEVLAGLATAGGYAAIAQKQENDPWHFGHRAWARELLRAR